MMRILVSPAAMKGTLTAVQFANAIGEGLKQAGHINIVKLPIADGGDDTALLLANALNAQFIPAEVSDPLGRNISSGFYLNASGTAIIEMAAASGLRLLKKEEYSATNTSSYGTGQLIKMAIENGAQKIILGVGGSATVDAGMGALLALGFGFFDGRQMLELGNGTTLGQVIGIDLTQIDRKLKNIEITILADVVNPILGENGAAAIFAPQKGATLADVKMLQKNLSLFTGVLYQTTGIDVAKLRGGGAAGGIAASFYALLGAKIESGAEFILKTIGFFEEAKSCDLIITGEGRIDESSFSGKATGAVFKFGTKIEVPVYAICGSATIIDTNNTIVSLVDPTVTEIDAMNNPHKNVVIKSMRLGNFLKNKYE